MRRLECCLAQELQRTGSCLTSMPGPNANLTGEDGSEALKFGGIARIPRVRDKSSRFTRRMGFTLVELLVVIAILAILLSLILAALARARASASAVACCA